MKTVYFVTGNQGKIDKMNSFVDEFSSDINFEMLKLDFVELKDENSMENTALNKAMTCYEMTGKDVIVSDVGIFIEALNGFPGINTASTIKAIGNEGILKLMDGITNRDAMYQFSLGYVDSNGIKKVFTAKTTIQIANNVGGKQGFAWDFIALGNGERFSDNLMNDKRMFPYKDATRQLVEFLKNG